MPELRIFAVRVKKIRTKMGLTQAEKLSTLQKVAALTGLTVSELLSIEMTEEESGLVSGSV